MRKSTLILGCALIAALAIGATFLLCQKATTSSTSEISANSIFKKAKRYQAQGMTMETALALWQASVMGDEKEVNAYIRKNEEARRMIRLLKLTQTDLSDKEACEQLSLLAAANDKAFSIIYDFVSMAVENDTEADDNSYEEMSTKYADNPYFMYWTARIEKNGDRSQMSHEEIFNHFNDAAAGGCLVAYTEVAEAYRLGRGVEQNLAKAEEWFQRAFEAGVLDDYSAGHLLKMHEENTDDMPESVRNVLHRILASPFREWLKVQNIE